MRIYLLSDCNAPKNRFQMGRWGYAKRQEFVLQGIGVPQDVVTGAAQLPMRHARLAHVEVACAAAPHGYALVDLHLTHVANEVLLRGN